MAQKWVGLRPFSPPSLEYIVRCLNISISKHNIVSYSVLCPLPCFCNEKITLQEKHFWIRAYKKGNFSPILVKLFNSVPKLNHGRNSQKNELWIGHKNDKKEGLDQYTYVMLWKITRATVLSTAALFIKREDHEKNVTVFFVVVVCSIEVYLNT